MGTRIIIKGADFSKCAVGSEDVTPTEVFVGTNQSLWGNADREINSGAFGFKSSVGGTVTGFTIKAENPGNVNVVVCDDSGVIYQSGSVAVSVGTGTYNINPIPVVSGQYVGLLFSTYVCKYKYEGSGDVQTYTLSGIPQADSPIRIYPFNIIISH